MGVDVIGVVEAGEHTWVQVLGAGLGVRGALALQGAGVEAIEVEGPAADVLLRRLTSDDRVRVPVRPRGSEGGVRVADGECVDTRAMKARLRGEVDGVCVPARTVAEQKDAARALLRSLRKPQDGWVSTRLNRHVSLFVTRGLVWLPIRPNALSVVILAIGLYGAWLAARGTWAGLALGGVLFQLQSILDGCDGELSRLTFRGSKAGEWLDTVGDDLTNYSFFAGAALGLHRMGLGALPLWLGAVGVTLGVVTSGIEYAYLIRIGSGDLLKYPLGFGDDPAPVADPTPIARVLGALRPAFKRDFFVFLAMLCAIAGAWPTLVMLALFVGGAVATFSAVLASEWRRRGRL